MSTQPVIDTNKLVLRPFTFADAEIVQRLVGDIRIAEMIENFPHPYLDGMAEEWIQFITTGWESGSQAAFGICEKPGGELVGCCDLTINQNTITK